MGGFGSGGSRVGAGRKSKGARVLDLHGGRDRKPQPAAVPVELKPVKPPRGLRGQELTVWGRLAPQALQKLTLTESEADALADLCVCIVERDRIRKTIDKDGWTFKHAILDDEGETLSTDIKKHPLIGEYRQWKIRVEAGRARFKLAPIGKEIVTPVKDVDPFEEFDIEGQVG
jgi:hypothetical protein